MGRKRARKVEHLFFHVACSVIVLIGLAGCAHQAPPPSDTPEIKAQALLSSAAYEAAQGDFDHALKTNEDVISRYSEIAGDRALYQRGWFFLHPNNPKKNPAKAIGHFSKLKDRFPYSELSDEAETWIITLRAIEQKDLSITVLKNEIQNNQDAMTLLTRKNNTLKARVKNLKRENQNLETQIQKLKNVDLGIEQKKREAAGHSPR